MEDMSKVKALPEKPVTRLRPGQRALGGRLDLDLFRDPKDGGEADLAGDTFWNLYQDTPQDLDTIPADRAVNRALLDMVRKTNGWAKTKASTAGNLPASLVATGLTWAGLAKDEMVEKALEKQREAEDLEAQAEQLDREAQAQSMEADALDAAAAGMGGDAAAQAQAQAQAARQAADQAKAQAQAARGAAQAKAQEALAGLEKDVAGNPFRQAEMAANMREVADQAKEAAEAAAGWGLGPSSPVNYDPAQALEFLEMNKGKIAQIAKLAGRLRGAAFNARLSTVPSAAPAKVGTTRDITRIMPTELYKMGPHAPDMLKATTAAQWADQGLTGWVPQEDKEREGPFVGALDVSPSMRGQREIVGKAAILGMAQVAQADGRDFILFQFSSEGFPMTAVTNREDWKELLQWAGMSTQGGGTDFNMAIRRGMELVGTLDNADFVFISDGEAGVAADVAAEWEDFRNQTGARLFYVPVGYGGYTDIDNLADEVVRTQDLDPEMGEDLARRVGTWLQS